MVQVLDRLTLDKPRRTTDGYLAVRAKAARTGVYDYLAGEIGAPDTFKPTDKVKVYRDEAEVFAEDAVRSFIGRPITNDHPAEAVTADNWKQHARGTVMSALRDGDFLAFDLVLMDAEAIADVEKGKRELSNGYACDFDWTPGTAPDGTAYDARQTQIRGNHVAVVDKGRAGPSCAIADGQRFAICDANLSALDGISKEPTMKIKIGDAEVDATNGEAVRIAVDALNVKLAATDKRATDAEAKVVEHAATITARDTRITELETELKDAAITPAKLADAAKEYAAVQAKAKALGVTVDGEADAAAIRKAVVDAKMGDAAKDYTADHIDIAFVALTKDVKVDDTNVFDIGRAKPTDDEMKPVADAYDAMVKDLTDRQPAAA